jgi:hypothetical protein
LVASIIQRSVAGTRSSRLVYGGCHRTNQDELDKNQRQQQEQRQNKCEFDKSLTAPGGISALMIAPQEGCKSGLSCLLGLGGAGGSVTPAQKELTATLERTFATGRWIPQHLVKPSASRIKSRDHPILTVEECRLFEQQGRRPAPNQHVPTRLQTKKSRESPDSPRCETKYEPGRRDALGQLQSNYRQLTTL